MTPEELAENYSVEVLQKAKEILTNATGEGNGSGKGKNFCQK